MNHDKYKELIQLYVYDDISDEKRTDLENHLFECEECSKELEAVKKIYVNLTSNRPDVVSQESLVSARRNLFASIKKEESKVTFGERINGFFNNLFFSNYKLAFGGIATFTVGVLIGYFLFAGNSLNNDQNTSLYSINIDDITKSKVQLSNIRFKEPVISDGQVEFIFNATQPVTYKGNVNDEVVQRLLAIAMLTADNPGVRLQSVNTIAMQTDDSFIPDEKVKKALLASLETDDNPGVRRAAINTLMKFPLDREIRDVLLNVLSNDDNAGIRVAAVNALSRLKSSGQSIDDEFKKALKSKTEDDRNNLIKLRAASILEEVE